MTFTFPILGRVGGLVHWQLNAVHRLQQVSYLLLFCRWTAFNSQHKFLAIKAFVTSVEYMIDYRIIISYDWDIKIPAG